jgi:hypothetical protein
MAVMSIYWVPVQISTWIYGSELFHFMADRWQEAANSYKPIIFFATDSPGEIISKRGLLRRLSLGRHGLTRTFMLGCLDAGTLGC